MGIAGGATEFTIHRCFYNKNKMFHTVYLSFEDGTIGRDYIGKHSTENPYDEYLGSYKDSTFNPTGKIILEYAKTEEGAVEAEIRWQNVFKVAEDPQFANKSYQTSEKFVFNKSGPEHPNHGRSRPDLVARNLSDNPVYRPEVMSKREEINQKIGERTKEALSRPEVKRKHVEANRRITQNEKYRLEHSSRMKEVGSREEVKQKKSKAITGRKWYVNQSGETKMEHHPPGPEWKEGRKWIKGKTK
jgi:hypothetical protein